MIILCCSPTSDAKDEADLYITLEQMNELVLSDPLSALQQLEAMAVTVDDNERQNYFLWQLRRIQAFNYSYQFEKFDQLLESVFSEVDKNVSPEIRAYLLMYIGVMEQRKGEYQSSIKHLRESKEIALKHQEEFILTVSLVELSYSLALAEQYELAMLEMHLAYQMANKLKNPFLSGLVEEGNGTLLGYTSQYEESLKHYFRADEYYSKTGYPYYIGESAYGLASTYRYAKEWDKALAWYNNYHQAVKLFDNEYPRFFYHYGLGMTYASKGDCRAALETISKVLSVTEFKDYKAELYKKMSYCLGTFNDFVAAEAALGEARIIYQDIPELIGTTWELEIQKIEAQLKTMQGDHKKAYELLEDYYQVYLKVHDKNTSERLDKLRLAVQNERKKLEVKLLEKQAEIQKSQIQTQLRKNEIQQLWLIGSVLLIVVIFGILAWQIIIGKKFRALAIIDELTGLYNRRYIFSTIEKVLAKKAERKIHHTVMLIDIDNLKPINDQFGHQVGDQVIKAVALSGERVIRDGDVFARIGGDEFMLFLSRTEEEENETSIANRLREEILKHRIELPSKEEVGISISIGIASIKQRNDSLESVYSRVDKALYEAKFGDKNKVVHSEQLA